jgi:hypothetical protein
VKNGFRLRTKADPARLDGAGRIEARAASAPVANSMIQEMLRGCAEVGLALDAA